MFYVDDNNNNNNNKFKFGLFDEFIDKHFIHEKLHKNVFDKLKNNNNVENNVIDEVTHRIAYERDTVILLRLRNLMFICIIIPILVSFDTIRHLYDGQYLRVVIIVIAVAFGTLLPLFALRKKEKPNLKFYGNITTIFTFLASIGINTLNGGFGEPTIVSCLIPCLLSLVVLDEISTLFWGASVFVQIAYLHYLHSIGTEFIYRRIVSLDTLTSYTSTLCAAIFVYLCIFYRLFVSMRFRNMQTHALMNLLEKQKNEALNARKDIEKYISRMSHEYRSPLHGITSLTELAINEKNDPKAVENYLTTSLGVCKTLKTLVGDILTFFSSKHTPLSLNMSTVIVNDVVERVLQSLEHLRNDDVQFNAHIGDNIVGIVGDEVRISQCLFNLIGNSQKFTFKGFINVSVTLNSIDNILKTLSVDPSYFSYEFIDKSNRTKKYICFEIKDTGIGMEQDKIARMFQPFVQADSSIARRFGGSGLGLSIVMDIVCAMKGIIWIKSKVNYGTSINIAFPYIPSFHSPRRPSPSEKFVFENAADDVFNVLVVDDSKLNLKVTQKMLNNIGIKSIKTTVNGYKAIEMSKTEKFNVYLIDLHMPEIDGLELMLKLKELEKNGVYKDSIFRKYIAFTADVNPSVFEKCRKAGFNGILSKPARRSDFIEMFNNKIPLIVEESDWIGCTEI